MKPFTSSKQIGPPLEGSLFLTLLILVCFALSSQTQAVNPPLTAVPNPALAGGNTADGQLALGGLTTGIYNSAFGIYALLSNADANFNTGVGAGVLLVNTANENTAVGAGALLSNTTGSENTANGAFALFSNTEGNTNTAVGNGALFSNTEGSANTAVGSKALGSIQTNDSSTAVGFQALASASTGRNDAFGYGALQNHTTGSQNTAIGNVALYNHDDGNDNVALGVGAGFNLVTGSGNVYIGFNVEGVDGENDTTYIRNVYDSQATARPVYVNADNKIGTQSSSRRYKEEIKPMGKASEALLSLKPITFRYKKEVDRSQGLSFGLIAEEVAEISPDLITRDRDGKPETVRYEAVNAMLLNEFLKEHKKVETQQRKIDEQQATIAEMKSTIAQQQKGMEVFIAQLKEQARQIQRVSSQLEMRKRAPQVAAK